MGLDLRPMGKPKTGYEKRFHQIINIIEGKEKQELSFFDKIKGKKIKTKDELLKEWNNIQISPLETIKAPKVGRDFDANAWLMKAYFKSDKSLSVDEFKKKHNGYYVISYAPEVDGVPVYNSPIEDENSFRGQFLKECVDLIGEELVNEAWGTKFSGKETLDYGVRLMNVADSIAEKEKLEYLKEQRDAPDSSPETIESKLHIVYSLAKWMTFYGKNGHGFEAYF